jgi:glyoxylase-like metal-dependent hydrolase (beta-lactamase superfamily II)
MKVRNLSGQSSEYTSNVYHAIGEYLQLSDLNTLIDVGRDQSVLGQLRTIRTGIGKKPVDQIYLTHSHFDHAALLNEILSRYPVPVYAHPESRIPGIIPLSDGKIIQIADRNCEVIWARAHSEDSICYYCPDDGLLFSGDIPVRIYTSDGVYNPDFLPVFEKICSFDISTIFPGHGDPIEGNLDHLLNVSFHNLKESRFA